MINTVKRCATCAAFCALEKQCRREAPKLVSGVSNGSLQTFGTWPPTTADLWCLQWVAGEQAGETAQ